MSLEVHVKWGGLIILRLVVIISQLNRRKTYQIFLLLVLQIRDKESLAFPLQECGKNHLGTCKRDSCACFNCGRFYHKVTDCPNTSNSSSFKTEGSVHKPSVKTVESNKDARPRNTQATCASGANKASGYQGYCTCLFYEEEE